MWKALGERVRDDVRHLGKVIDEQESVAQPVPHQPDGPKVAKFLVAGLLVATLLAFAERNNKHLQH